MHTAYDDEKPGDQEFENKAALWLKYLLFHTAAFLVEIT